MRHATDPMPTPRGRSPNALDDCPPISIREARRRHYVPLTLPLDPERDRRMIVSVVGDLASGNIRFALVHRKFPRRFMSRRQRTDLSRKYGIEIWRALHRPETASCLHRKTH